ncbi:MAG TPA: hypothetical protein VGH65_05505 [Verrucomicrobiaceae bacterium]|jgi:hypothetical protein
MLKKIQTLFVFALAFPAASQAFNGGPFDNADNSSTFDSAGIYQYAMRFQNGSGFAQWGPNVALSPNVNQGAGNATNTVLTLGTPLNRSVIYYKGVTFVGNATGMVDQERGKITGITNSYTSLTSSTSANSGGTAAQSVTASAVVVDNGTISSTANTHFEGDIYQKSPILKFHGSGEIAVLNPSLSDSLFSALTNLIGAIPQAATIGTGAGAAINAINSAIQSLIGNTFGTGNTNIPPVSSADAIYNNADVAPMKVFGSRIFFNGSPAFR